MISNLSAFTQIVQRGWWVVVLATLAALNTALLLVYFSPPMYEASATFVVSPTDAVADNGDLIYSIDTLSRRSVVATYAEVLNSAHVLQSAENALGATPEMLEEYTVSGVVLPETNVLQLTVKGSDPVFAARLANAIGEQTISFVSQLSRIYDIKILDSALPPTTPYSPRPLRDIGLAAAVGLISGIALAVIYVQLRFMPVMEVEPA